MSKKRQKGESVATASPDLVDERLKQLRQLFPDVITEGKVDVEKLRYALGGVTDDRPERYSFTWAGKRDAIRLLQTPSRATLVPCPDESVNFDTTQNIFIEGDNLEVLKLLYKSYASRVKMIYIDPPYNTGNDFIYPDNFADPLDTYLKLTGQKAENGDLLTSNPETSGRYHSTWLSMMYPRLFVARQLLSNDGLVFISIDDHELANLQLLMNEVFGEENFVSAIVIQSNKRGQTYKAIAKTHEYLLVYSRTSDISIGELKKEGDALPFKDSVGDFDLWELRNRNPKFGRHNRPNLYFPIYVAPEIHDECGFSKVSLKRSATYHIEVVPKDSDGRDSCWRWSQKKIKSEDIASATPVVVAKQRRDGGWNVYERSRKSTTKAKSLWTETAVISEQGTMELGELDLGDKFDHPKPVGLIAKCLKIATEEDDIVLDFFAGSCSTAHALFNVNRDDGGRRRFVMVQLPEPTPEGSAAKKAGFRTIAEIGIERVRRVIKKLKKEAKGKSDLKDREQPEDLGFRVFKLAESHFRRWVGTEEKDPKEWAKQMELFVDPFLPGWEILNIIHEVALKEGYSLTSRIEQLKAKKMKTNTVYRVTDDDRGQSFLICLDNKLKAATPKALGLKKDDIFICRDVALTDELAANLALQCRLKTI